MEVRRASREAGKFRDLPDGQGIHLGKQGCGSRQGDGSQRLAAAQEKILSGAYDVVVLDEINYALGYGFLPLADVVEFLRNKPAMLHVVLTGRNAKPEIVEIADLVTEMRQVKHPFEQGIGAQPGIEF